MSHLVLYGGWVEGDAVAAPAVREHVLGLVDQHWGLASDVLTEIFAPEADAGFRAVFSRYQRESSSAARAHQLLAACYDIDVSDDLGRITAPTSVIHRRDDRAVPLAEGERLAAGIDGRDADRAGRSHAHPLRRRRALRPQRDAPAAWGWPRSSARRRPR